MTSSDNERPRSNSGERGSDRGEIILWNFAILYYVLTKTRISLYIHYYAIASRVHIINSELEIHVKFPVHEY